MSSIGKQRGLSRLADEDGYFVMVALDQRPPMAQAIAAARNMNPSNVGFSEMLAAKRMLVRGLACDASSMLFDPNYAIPAAMDVLPARTGLIVTLEDHRFVETSGGRFSRSIDNWSVEKIRRMGADAVKVLIWYRPDASKEVLRHQQNYVRSVGAECRRHDIPFVLELLVFPFPENANNSSGYVESSDKNADQVVDSVTEFARPEYGVDLFKLETPIPVASLPEKDGSTASREAASSFDEIGRICRNAGIPWVLLSGGAPTEQFERVLSYSYAAGAQGFQAGRTIWLDAVRSNFPNDDAVICALESTGRKILGRLRDLTHAEASPWTPSFGFEGIESEGTFSMTYA